MATIFLFHLSLLILFPFSLSQPKGFLIDCGATSESEIDGRKWLPDGDFISTGLPKNITVPGLLLTLTTVRSFPLQNNLNRKFCYGFEVYRGAKYLVRTTYYYGGINSKVSPPVFDQIVDGTFWGMVNTTEDYTNGMSSYYEGVFLAQGKTMSVCIGANAYTDSDPFISALEVVILNNSLYNSTDFNAYGLSLVSRHSFGYSGPIVRYPDDEFDRFWEPFGENTSTTATSRNVSVSGFWNLPPSKIFDTELTIGRLEQMEFKWPPVSLLNSTYYIALYFADERNSWSEDSRVLDISINGITYYRNLTVTPAGIVVFATKWPLGGPTRITLTPAASSSLGPSINGGEVFDMLPLGGRTLTRDVIALHKLKDDLQNPPHDWNGDPCMPHQYSWTGITCSEGFRIRVVTLNLTNMDLSGSLSSSIANMTGLTGIWFGSNRLSGTIPDLSSLKMLKTLHLNDNEFTGEIPSSLGNINGLQELFLQNNSLTGQIPNSLEGKSGLDLRTSGNLLSTPPTS